MDTRTFLMLLVAMVAALALAAFQYFYKSKGRSKTRIWLAFLRFLSLFLVFIILINPNIERQVLELDKPKLAIAIDNSSSIAILNESDKVRSVLGNFSEDQELNEKFDVTYFSFDDDLQVLDSLNFNINRTNIEQSLRSLDKIQTSSDALLLITDGNQTMGSSYDFYKSKAQLYPVVVGDTIAQEDLKISKVNVNRYSYLNNNFPVEVIVNYNGSSALSRDLVIYREGTVVARKRLSLNEQNNSARVSIDLKADRVGQLNYRMRLAPLSNEVNTINNRSNFSVEVIDEQAKIALVYSFYHPDLGMLKRAIESNEQRQVRLLEVDQVNTLDEFQMVIVYQPDRRFTKLFEQLNEGPMNYFIITGTQTDWPFLNTAQEHFKKSTINQTESYQAIQNLTYGAFVIKDVDFENLPPLEGVFGNVDMNSPSEMLLYQRVNNIPTEKPLLATFSKDEFRGAVLFGEGIWRWRAYSYTLNKSFYEFDQFINKLVQFLSLKKRAQRLELEYPSLVYQNDLITIDATYFDSNYNVDTRASLRLSLRNKSSNEVKSYPFRRRGQLYTSAISGLDSGDYAFTVSVSDEQLSRSGSFTVLDYNIEQQFSYANINSIKSLANANNTKYYHISELEGLIEELKEDEQFTPVQRSELRQSSLIDWKWLLGFIALFLSLEWFIRKYYGKI